MPLQLRYVTHSEIGLVRKNNQDSGFASPHLLVVADGMGGAAAGDLASAVAIDTIKGVESDVRHDEMLTVLAGAIDRANDRIADLVEADYSLEGMGTTVTGIMFDGAELGLAHIGDSRAYRYRADRLERLTHDHSWVQSLIDEGKISEDEAAVHPHRSLLLKVLNGQSANDPDLSLLTAEVGDRLLICSDGLCGLVDDATIAAGLAAPDLGDALRLLVDEALAEGGIDNITVIVADVVDPDATSTAATDDRVVLGAAAERKIPPVGGADTATGAIAAVQEDTIALDGVTPRPAFVEGADPDVVEADDEARYNPRPPHRRRFLRPVIGLLALLLILGAGVSAGYAWTRTQYYVGVSGDQVAIFKGIADSLPGIPLSHVYEVQPLAVSALPPYYQERVRATMEVASLEDARASIGILTEAARRCAGQPTTTPPTSSGSASTKPASGKPTATPRTTASPSPSQTLDPEQAC